jgi:cell fate (sporulation/competence/biofilm development) regulator YlbF (YheA/YmcA/DUF963 family)
MKRIITIAALLGIAGIVFFGYRLLQKTAPATPQTPASAEQLLEVRHDSLLLSQNGLATVTVLFDSTKLIKPGFYTLFDSLVSRTELFSKSQLNYPNNKASQLRNIINEKESITDFFREKGFRIPADSLPLRQLIFKMMLDTVKKAQAAGKQVTINGNKEIVYTNAVTPAAAAAADGGETPSLMPLLISGGILSLAALAALFLNTGNAMATRKKKTGTDEDSLRHNVYETLGRNTPEAKYFTEVLSGYKNHAQLKEQIKPDSRPDTGELIANLKKAGILTDGESKKLYDAYELKEDMQAIQAEGITPQDKQQHLMQVLQSLTRDPALKQYLADAAGEGRLWAGVAMTAENEVPEALQKMIAYYDGKYGGGQHKLSGAYNELLRRYTLEIPENFVAEDQFLKALHAQYRNLLNDVLYTYFDQQHNEDKVKEARQVLASRLAQLAFHTHSFLTHYTKSTADLPPDTVKTNMALITQGGTVTGQAAKEVYKTYSRDITRFEREIFLQKLLAGMGVSELENVLVKGVYFPPESFE